MERLCPATGARKIKIAETRSWFEERSGPGLLMGNPPGDKPVARGCPFDCGLCRAHLAELRLPIFSVTNQCQLACPVCFTHNRPDLVYHKSMSELGEILDAVESRSRSLDLVNLTGGEPFLHPGIMGILEECARRSFGNVSVNTNGLKIAADRALAEKVKEAGAEVVLSLDTLDPSTSLVIHGADIVKEKIRALETLESLDIPTILLPVWIPSLNDREIPFLLREYFHRPFVKGVTVQTVAYTGLRGGRFEPRRRATIEEVESALSDAGIGAGDFFRHGSYHPLCYSTAYYLTDRDAKIPLASLADKADLTEATADGYLMRPADKLLAAVRDRIDQIWARGASKDETRLLRKLVASMRPPPGAADQDAGAREWLRLQRKAFLDLGLVKTVTVHAHMDEDNFDLARVSYCGDLVPEEDGSMRPACAYNLLYRERDPRFWAGEVAVKAEEKEEPKEGREPKEGKEGGV
jgi:uncharacterized radical SAM superfamily Fe-S cluster-containing enzyme